MTTYSVSHNKPPGHPDRLTAELIAHAFNRWAVLHGANQDRPAMEQEFARKLNPEAAQNFGLSIVEVKG